MASYLLSTRALYEFVNGPRTRAVRFRDWCTALEPRDQLFASEISLGELRWSVEQILVLTTRETWRHYLDHKIPMVFKSRLLPFSREHARAWGLVRLVGEPPLPSEETQLIGQAIANELTLVGPTTPTHALFGHRHLDPYDSADWPA